MKMRVPYYSILPVSDVLKLTKIMEFIKEHVAYEQLIC